MYTLCMSSINLTENGNCRYVILLEEKHIGSIMLFLHVSICISTKLQVFSSFGWTGIVDICIFSPYIEDLEPRLFNHNMPKIQCNFTTECARQSTQTTPMPTSVCSDDYSLQRHFPPLFSLVRQRGNRSAVDYTF